MATHRNTTSDWEHRRTTSFPSTALKSLLRKTIWQRLERGWRKPPPALSEIEAHLLGDAVLRLKERCIIPPDEFDAAETSAALAQLAKGLGELHRAGWALANHSAAHYPIGEEHIGISRVEQFLECEQFLVGITGAETAYWVPPFDQNVEFSVLAPARTAGKRPLVIMRDKVNRPGTGQDPDLLYRIHSPYNDRHGLLSALEQASRAGSTNGGR